MRSWSGHWGFLLVAGIVLAGCGDTPPTSPSSPPLAPQGITPILEPIKRYGSGCSDRPPVLDLTQATRVTQCSQAALVEAIAATSNGRIVLPTGCSMTLTTPVQVNKDLVIEGSGATISGGGSTRLFEVGRNPSSPRGYRFALQNATLTRGRDTGSGGAAVRGGQFGTLTFLNVMFSHNVSTGAGGEDGGGAVFKDEGGRLTVFNSTFVGNRATNGGAIKSLLANVQIVNSTFEGNAAAGGNNGGGAVFIDGLEISPSRPSISQGGYWPNGYVNDTYGKARVCGALFRGNTVGAQYDFNRTGRQGGGLFTHVYGAGGDNSTAAGAALIEVERSLFEGNTSVGDGGGLRAGGNGRGQANVSHSVFVNNRGAHGGAVRLSQTAAAFVNTSLVSNCAGLDGTTSTACTDRDNNGPALGGGIAAFDNRYTVARVTVARNRAGGYAGAFQQSSAPADVGSIVDTLVADNTVGNTYGVTRTCGSRLTNGANSWQWPAPIPNDPNDPGCGARTTANPVIDVEPTECGLTVGSSATGRSQIFPVWLPAAGGPVPRVGGVPTAGAVCPANPP